MIGHKNVITWISVFCLSLVVNTAQADRVKDLTNVGGVRGNHWSVTVWSSAWQALVMARIRHLPGRA